MLSGCGGCSKSGSRAKQEKQIFRQDNNVENGPRTLGNIVRMRQESGVYYVPITINGIPMEFIFDTGASIISISSTEAIFLIKQGKLLESDILGSSYFSDATGAISEGTRINLREVQIGNKKIYNIEASVVHNLEAPLLLGQSALTKFGKISIDYNKKQLILD